MSSSLETLRQIIDAADDELVKALARRMEAVERILEEKEAKGLPLFDSDREKALLEKLARQAEERKLDPRLVERVLREVISHSRQVQTRRVLEDQNPGLKGTTKVAYQGATGSYSWAASRSHFGDDVETLGYESFREALQALADGEVDAAMLPVENTLAGSIHEVYDLLASSRMHVIGEEVVRVDHCLIGLEQQALESIRTVLSHPVALQQCDTFLRGLPQASCVSYSDTAEAVLKVKRDGDSSKAAIASREAAEFYGLQILREGVSNHRENYTRFWAVSVLPASVDGRIPAKTSLLLVTDHRQGALVYSLSALAAHGLNMSKLESRPRHGFPWQYQFYLDVEGNAADEAMVRALDKVRSRARLLRVLGCYPRGGGNDLPKPVEALNPSARKRPTVRLGALESRRKLQRPRPVAVGGMEIGSGELVVMAGAAGPWSLERHQERAEQAAEWGVHILRCGRCATSSGPLGEAPMDDQMLAQAVEAAHSQGLALACETESPESVELLADWADLIIAGPQHMQNYPLLRELGRCSKPVMLERSTNSTAEEFAAAAEQILEEGNQQVILCERGIRTFDPARTTLDLGALEELKSRLKHPVMVDPTRAARKAAGVMMLAKAAHAAGADGLCLEFAGPDEVDPRALTGDEISDLIAGFGRGR